ncbi:hypothetical protein ADUPG1_014013, partial [Aduncisulcus paluster]
MKRIGSEDIIGSPEKEQKSSIDCAIVGGERDGLDEPMVIVEK